MNLVPKSRVMSFALTFLLGPIGLLYSAPLWGVMLTILLVLTWSTVLVPIAIWLLSWGLGDYYAASHNENIQAIKALHGKE
ncbi:hypothetical protein [Vibrio furnissii]|uniref:hypothetical protein n=1 Tax=Vibrio furnissii TaxID=29494 RepID=UPI001EEA8960|nr:hypothetical protein [Vibrio furnissii]MCG6216231.1 hypothetical protein [Vibrio furnissii]